MVTRRLRRRGGSGGGGGRGGGKVADRRYCTLLASAGPRRYPSHGYQPEGLLLSLKPKPRPSLVLLPNPYLETHASVLRVGNSSTVQGPSPQGISLKGISAWRRREKGAAQDVPRAQSLRASCCGGLRPLLSPPPLPPPPSPGSRPMELESYVPSTTGSQKDRMCLDEVLSAISICLLQS